MAEKFYLGRLHDIKTRRTGKESLLYDPDDLVTHGVVFGMTGSGKTGLCIDVLEEAALQGIPALMIDPKGDITNALLHFPNLLPKDFEPWVNPDEARREGKTVELLAEETAKTWKAGLAMWNITPERIQALSDSVEFAVYTPGSDAGLPVSILASLSSPAIEWDSNKEIIRERIASTATAILGLVGYENIDPVKSREHILLANLFEAAWSTGTDLDLSTLIYQVQNPPMKQLGVFDMEEFFPSKERGEMAMRLNNILAAPSFQAWLEGQPLDIQTLLFTKAGKPRHSVFTLGHLSEEERMFFVTLLYSAVETWMHSQPGTSSLRAIVYFDEIHGYLPPVAEPPSKAPMLRLLKQARAFGVGQLLVTQNPVDVDYKALSNAGTWFIGKLQTERDKDRLLDGLEGAAPDGFKRADYSKIISGLDKRIFLLHNVHDNSPAVFETRWVMNYLAGPLTRNQIPLLNKLAGARAPAPASKGVDTVGAQSEASAQKPTVPSGVQEVFFPSSLSLEAAAEASHVGLPTAARRIGLLYRPALVAQAQLRFNLTKYKLDSQAQKTALVQEVSSASSVRWDDFEHPPVEERALEARPAAQASFTPLPGGLDDAGSLKKLEDEFKDWVYRSGEAKIWANDELKVYAGPETTREKFVELCQREADQHRDDEIEKSKDRYESKLKALEKKLAKEKRDLDKDEQRSSQKRMEEYTTHAENILSLFIGRRRTLTTSLTKHRLASEAAANVKESQAEIEEIQSQMNEMSQEIQDTVKEVDARWDEVAQKIAQIPVSPTRGDVFVTLFGIAWLPYHRVDLGGREEQLPAFE